MNPTATSSSSRQRPRPGTLRVTPRPVRAHSAVISGDAATHDLDRGRCIQDLIPQVDVIVLAQASMARVVKTLYRRGASPSPSWRARDWRSSIWHTCSEEDR